MRKGFIIDLQSGLNWNGIHEFPDVDAGTVTLFPASSSLLYGRKTRIGDMWKVAGSSETGRLTLSGSSDTIDVAINDYLIAIATGSDGYVCRHSASHWEIHKSSPTAGVGLTLGTTNILSVVSENNHGLKASTDGLAITGSNMPTPKTDITDDDTILYLSGSDGSPQSITYSNFITDLTPSLTDKFADQYRILTYKLEAYDETFYGNAGTLPITFNFVDNVDFAASTDFNAAIGNLFLKVSGSVHYNPGVDVDATEYEIYAEQVGSSGLKFTLTNLKFKPEEGDLFQAFCFLSGSSAVISSVSGPAE